MNKSNKRKGTYLLYKKEREGKKAEVVSNGKQVFAKFEDVENNTMVFMRKDLPIVVIRLVEEGYEILDNIKKL